MCPTHLALRIPAKHAGNLADPAGTFEYRDVSGRDTSLRSLGDHDVMVRAGGDLREMRDREYLVLLRNPPQRVADLQSYSAADARIDLVEDQSRHLIDSRQNRLEREHH